MVKKFYLLIIIVSLIFLGCAAAPADYNSFSYRENRFTETNVTISEKKKYKGL
jgi:PBP1b-binding outer membrane lipoprotein LpoB